MSGTFVVVRLPSAGMVFGEVLSRHPGSRLTSVPIARQEAAGHHGVLELLALVEGLPDAALASALLSWNRVYGRPAHVIGESFALRLPMDVDAVHSRATARLLEADRALRVEGNVMEGQWTEQWIACPSEAEADAMAGRMRQLLAGDPGVEVRTAEPKRHDLECWEVLRFAGEVAAEAMA